METKILKKPDGLSREHGGERRSLANNYPKRNDQAMRADFLDTSTEPIPRNKKVVEILTGWRVGADKHEDERAEWSMKELFALATTNQSG